MTTQLFGSDIDAYIAKRFPLVPTEVPAVPVPAVPVVPAPKVVPVYKRAKTVLQSDNAKTVKGEKLGVETAICYLAPAWESGVMNTCTFSTEACREFCLNESGMAQVFPSIRLARIAKTVWLHSHRESWLAQLRKDIIALVKRAKKNKRIPACRINGTSDIPWIPLLMASEFPTVQFYDYTKIPNPARRVRSNYHLTFSYSGHNLAESMEALASGVNVAVVFAIKKGATLPETWNGYPVIDGDLSDARFMDDKGVVVGLRAKGVAKSATASPFVVLS